MNLVMKQGKVAKLEELPENSIAIDGFVIGPEIDSIHRRFSFDHHGSKCLRLATNSAAMQCWTAIMLGLDASESTIYCNHCDSDVAMAVFCLKNPERCSDPLVKKLVDAINLSDMHSGAVIFNGNSKLVEWISAPEVDSKKNNDYSKLSDEGLLTILESILHRIELYVNGEASIEIVKQHLKCEYKVLSNENGWVMVESEDSHVYSALYHAGFDRIVLMHKQPDGSTAYSLAKRSDFISNFNLPEIFSQLNLLEPGWGGGSTIGGAPRNPDGSRSKLPPEKVAEVINNCILGVYKKVKKPRKTSSKK